MNVAFTAIISHVGLTDLGSGETDFWQWWLILETVTMVT